MRAETSGSGDFENPKEGVTVGRCYRIVDLGTQEQKYQGNVNYKRQILVSFELPLLTMELDGEKIPMAISKKYTLSFNGKASLRKDMEAWYGKKFNDKDIEASGGFDPTKILGKPGQILIEHNESQGKTYANVAGLMPLAEGQTCPDQVNESFVFDLDEFDRDKWDSLSEKMRSWIAKSPEAKKALGEGQPEKDNPAVVDDFEDLDLPF